MVLPGLGGGESRLRLGDRDIDLIPSTCLIDPSVLCTLFVHCRPPNTTYAFPDPSLCLVDCLWVCIVYHDATRPCGIPIEPESAGAAHPAAVLTSPRVVSPHRPYVVLGQRIS